MSALNDDREVKRKDGEYQTYKIQEDTIIYKGALVCIDAKSGYLVPLKDAKDQVFAGVALEQVNNSEGDSGDKEVRVQKTGSYQYVRVSADQGVVGSAAYGLDDQTVGKASTNSILVGYIQAVVDSSTVYVRIDRAVE